MVNVVNQTARFDVATAAIKGGRNCQEDNLIASFPQGQDIGFSVLADGMGGHLAGDVASALVMSEVFGQIKMKEMLLERQITDIPAILRKSAASANGRIRQYIEDDAETYGMGSTLLATVLRDDDLFWVSVGDSPLFLFRDGELTQLNQDHSMAPQIDMMVKVGAMDSEVGRNHPDRNTLTSAIAGVDIDKIDCPDTPTPVRQGDIVIAASDGLQFLSNDDIAGILRKMQDATSQEIGSALLAALDDLADPDQDNTVFAIVKLGERQAQTQPVSENAHSVLVQLRSDLGRAAPTPAPAEGVTEPNKHDAAPASNPSGLPEKRIIRLVTSKALSFDEPLAQDTPPKSDAPVEQVRPQGHSKWYRRQRSLGDQG